MESTLVKYQKKEYKKTFFEDSKEYIIIAKVRYDDQCGNGHNSFSITGEVWRAKNGAKIGRDMEMGGCIHEEIEKHFPELREFIKWHLVSSDMPMHYASNTLYHFSDKDYRGLRKGEKKQLKRGGKTPVWTKVVRDKDGNEVQMGLTDWKDSDEKPADEGLTISWEPVWIEGEGKKREIEYAKSSCVWGVAPDDSKYVFEEMTEKALANYLAIRLPHVQTAFRKAVESLGFTY